MTTERVLLVYAAILLSHALINHFGIRLVAWLNDFSVTVHVVGVVVIVGALLLFAPKQPLGFFFARITSNDQGLAVLVGVRRRAAAGAVDLHGLRRIGERVRGDGGSTPSRALGNRDGRGRLGRRRLPLLMALTLAIADIPVGAERA